MKTQVLCLQINLGYDSEKMQSINCGAIFFPSPTGAQAIEFTVSHHGANINSDTTMGELY